MQRIRWTHEVRAWMGPAFALTLLLAGCGQSEPAETTAATEQAAAAATTPTDAVKSFLSAIKDGDKDEADRMLTSLARQKTQEADLYVAPPGSSTAAFEIGEFEVEGRDAQVFCVWSDVNEEGQRQTDRIVWLLRQEPEGWRISGMATEIFPGEDPLILNFENPEEMMQKQRAAEEEMIRRATAALTQPSEPVVKSAKQPQADKTKK